MSMLAPPVLADTMQYTVCFTSVCMFDMFVTISAKVASAAVVTPFAVMADAIDDFPSLTDFFNWSKLLFSHSLYSKTKRRTEISSLFFFLYIFY